MELPDINKMSDDVMGREEALRGVEARVFWCVLRFLDRASNIFEEREMRRGEFVEAFADLVRMRDADVDARFATLSIDYFHFAFRWFVCLMQREVPPARVLEVWDAYVTSTDFRSFFPHCCLSLLSSLRVSLLHAEDFENCLSLLHRPPISAWTHDDVAAFLQFASQSHTLSSRTAARTALCMVLLLIFLSLLSLCAGLLAILLSLYVRLKSASVQVEVRQ